MSKITSKQPDKLTDQRTLEITQAVLAQHFDLSAEGYVCQTADLWQVLLTAAARQTYIETVCNELETVPDSNTIRGYLKEQLTPARIRELQRACNRALASQLPAWLKDQPKEIALDLHDEPYYGQDDLDDPDCWVCRGEARQGTTRFYRCATAYVLHKDVRFTLAVEFVQPDDDLVKITRRLILRVKALGIRVKSYDLDKGFCCIPVLRWLQSQGLAALIAAPLRGKKGGTRALCQGRRSYRTQHTFRSRQYGQLTVPVAVIRTFRKLKNGRRRAEWLVYVLLNLTEIPLRCLRKRYRRRFGIESSYRLLEQVRGRTTARNPALRFLWMGLALLIGNIWIALHWRYLRRCGSGPRRVARQHFTLAHMVHFLVHAIETIYEVVTLIDPPDVKPAIL